MIPVSYFWLMGDAPKMIKEALKEYGTLEFSGVMDNPKILGWADEVGIERHEYSADSIPWCGLFMAVVAKRAGKQIPEHPLWALNWRKFGVYTDFAMLGDVLVFIRPGGGGHVGLYVGQDIRAYHVLGGNQMDKVCFTRIAKERLVGVRRPVYKIGQPASVKQIFLSPSGELSNNET